MRTTFLRLYIFKTANDLENKKTNHSLGKKVFVKYISDNGLVSKIYKELLKSTIKKINRDFPSGLICNAGDVGLTPGWGTKTPYATEQLNPWATIREAVHWNKKFHMTQPRSHKAKTKGWFRQINKTFFLKKEKKMNRNFLCGPVVKIVPLVQKEVQSLGRELDPPCLN